jgi:hypothetical protein
MIETIMENWEAYSAIAGLGMACAGKLISLFIRSLGAVRDTWKETFPKKAEYS